MASKRTARQWSATLEDLIASKRAPRTLVVETLKHMKRALAWQHARWGVSLTTTDTVTDESGRRNHVWRKCRPDELPENDPAEWDRLIETAQALRVTAEELENFGHRQKAAAERRLAS